MATIKLSMNKDNLTSFVLILMQFIYFSGPVHTRTHSTVSKRRAKSENPYCIYNLNSKTINNSLSKYYLSYVLSMEVFS